MVIGLPVKVSIEQLRVEPAGKPFEEYLHRCLGLLEWEREEQAPITVSEAHWNVGGGGESLNTIF